MNNKENNINFCFDEKFMKEALEEAKKAFSANEVPIGAVLVYRNEIIARAHNQVESLQDASAHAELSCIKAASKILNNWRLLNTTLYTTLEPCSMCAGLLLLSRISTLVWGAKDLRHGANGSFIDIFAQKHPIHSIKIRSGVLHQECALLIKEFFQKRRSEKKTITNFPKSF